MEKIKKAHSQVIPSVNLYLDDIETIVSILEKESGNVTISDRDFVYDSLDQFIAKHGIAPTSLSLNIREPYVSLTFDRKEFPSSIWLYAQDGSDKSELVFHKIRDLLLQRIHWLNHVVRIDLSIFLIGILLVLAVLITNGIMEPLKTLPQGIGVLVLGYILYLFS